MRAIYASSYDRGLECLLDMWPKIHEQVPEATLDIYYGWNTFDMVHKGNPEMKQWRWAMARKMASLKSKGVTEHGRVDHDTLAQEFKNHTVWLYPTEFNEINCITALKAQAAGCIPVTTGCYALAETVFDHTYTTECTDIYTNEAKQAEYIDKAVKALKTDNWSTETKAKVPEYYWENIAQQWQEAL